MIRSIFRVPNLGDGLGGSSAPTGLPLEVADETARLALSPLEGRRVTQLSDGMVWAYESATWYPAPILDADLSVGNVAAPYNYKSQDNPFGAVGTFVPLSTPATILPQTAWANNIEQFAGTGSGNAVSISDMNVTYVSSNIAVRVYAAQQAALGTCDITFNCALDTVNVDDILFDLDAWGGTPTTGSITLAGANGPPTKQDKVTLPSGTMLNFGGSYPRTGTDGNGRGIYGGWSSEAPNDEFLIQYASMPSQWEIINVTAASAMVAHSDPTNADYFPWEHGYTDGTVSHTATQTDNAAKLSLIAKGLTVTTN